MLDTPQIRIYATVPAGGIDQMVTDESSLLRVLMSGLSTDESTKMADALNEATLSTEPDGHRRSPSVRQRRPRPSTPRSQTMDAVPGLE